MHKYNFQIGKATQALALVRACVAFVCDFKTEVEVVSHDGIFEPYWGNVKEVTFRKYKKNVRVENSAIE